MKPAHRFRAVWTPAAQNTHMGAASFLDDGDNPFEDAAPKVRQTVPARDSDFADRYDVSALNDREEPPF
jgi:hypothetical protein